MSAPQNTLAVSAAINRRVKKVFTEPDTKTDLVYLDCLVRNGQLLEEHVIDIFRFYFQMTDPWRMEIIVFLYNVVEKHYQFFKIEDLINLSNKWLEIERTKYISGSAITQLRQKLNRRIGDRQKVVKP